MNKRTTELNEKAPKLEEKRKRAKRQAEHVSLAQGENATDEAVSMQPLFSA